MDDIDVVISCLASRSGTKSDSYAIDYQATLNCLEVAQKRSVKHFVLLSAFCVQKPLLQFQFAKLDFEKKLREASGITHSIVRPTAFFKSVSGQLEVVQQGFPFVAFGDGKICKCNPISEADLASFIAECAVDPSKENRILNIGGPDEGLTKIDQANLLFKAIGKTPRFLYAPVWFFDVVISTLSSLSKISKTFEDPAELARIVKYYAVEDMLTTSPREKYGEMTLAEHFRKIAKEGQEYDPYTRIMDGFLEVFNDKFVNWGRSGRSVEVNHLESPKNATLA